MANETKFSDLADSTASEVLSGTYGRLLADRNAIFQHPALMYAGRINGTGSTTIRVPLLSIDATVDVASTSDGSEVAATVIADDKIDITVARYSKRYRPTDLARLTAAGGILDPSRWAQDAYVTNAMHLTGMIASLAGGFSSTVGTSGSDLTVAQLLEAKATLEIANVEGPYLCILHPRQFADVRAELASTSGGAVPFMAASQELINVRGNGYVGSFAGVDFFVSSKVATANAGADRAGGMFGRTAIAWADGSPIVDDPSRQISVPHGLFETERDAASGVTNWVTHAYLGAAEGNDSAGVSIITDA